MSDVFSHAYGRTTRKVAQPPGGASSINFGNQETPSSPKATVDVISEAAPSPAPAVESPEVTASPAVPPPGLDEALEQVKLKIVGTITSIDKDTPEIRTALADLIKKLETSGALKQASPAPLNADVALEKIRAGLKARGTHGIISIGKKFKSMNDDGDNKLSFDEFKKAIVEMGLGLNESDMHRVFRSFDADCSGYLSFDELLIGLKGELSKRRLEMVMLAFKVLDKDGSGKVTMADIEGRYDASKHPDVVLGVKDAKAVLDEFLSTFEQYGGGVKGDGVVSVEEFQKYYSAISASIDDDDYFELVIRNAWHISGGEGWCANTTCKRVLVLHEDGTQTVEEVKDDFDVDTKDLQAVKKKLVEQGLTDIKSIALYGDANEPSGTAVTKPAPSPAAAPAMTPGGRNKTMQLRSSIVFG